MALKMFFKEITSESLGIRGNYEKTAGSATIKKKTIVQNAKFRL